MKVKKIFLLSFISFYIAFLPAQNLENLKIEKGFKLEIFASDIASPRQLAEGDDQRIYVGSKQEGKIFALRDTDGNGVVDEKTLVAENLIFATGVSFFDGDLYFSEISKIWKIIKSF